MIICDYHDPELLSGAVTAQGVAVPFNRWWCPWLALCGDCWYLHHCRQTVANSKLLHHQCFMLAYLDFLFYMLAWHLRHFQVRLLVFAACLVVVVLLLSPAAGG